VLVETLLQRIAADQHLGPREIALLPRREPRALAAGQHKAEQQLRKARVDQLFDERASATVRPAITPKLPADNVVKIRRKRAA